ncbi:hypothetical protein GpartN1_g3819.t1 [Galdieria partita]|uniref:Oligosaccharyltransferase complex subunit n=1 Tax=Galdieria partita TaxID=83374 RepID=A0A9C7PWD1_9RHOD|nr:hypothetical protein GpartN1_g3819.t1 [Galdieria partita]
MNIPNKLFKLFFKVLRPPRLRLHLSLPSVPPWLIFVVILVSYILVISGIIYDVIVGPPAVGTTIDPLTQTLKPAAFAQGRINAQYVIEGLSVGFFYALGTSAIILLDVSSKSALLKDYKIQCWILAILLLLGFYRMMIVFVRIKLPGYLEFYYQ